MVPRRLRRGLRLRDLGLVLARGAQRCRAGLDRLRAMRGVAEVAALDVLAAALAVAAGGEAQGEGGGGERDETAGHAARRTPARRAETARPSAGAGPAPRAPPRRRHRPR